MKSYSYRLLTLFLLLISLFTNAAVIVTPARAAGEPTVTGVISNTANGAFNQGDSISVKVQFSEDVNVDTSGGTPTICFETGITDRCVNYASGSGTDTLTFDDYVVQAGDNSSDLEYVDTSALQLNGAVIQDIDLNDAILTLPTQGASGSFSYNNDFVVDTTAPTVADVISGTSDGSFNQGDHIEVSVQFSEVVNVNTGGGTPSICFETGTTDRCVNYASGSGTTTLTFDDYIVQAGDNSSDLEYVDTSALHLNSATIQDAAGNDANLTLPTTGSSGSFSYNNNFVVDTTAPTVADVISGTSDGSFNQGDHIGVSVQFSEVVNVNTSGGTPSICFETGTTDRCVNYASGSGTTTLTFDDYIVQAGDNSSDLEYVDTSALHLNSATIQDAAGNDANLTLPTPGSSGSFGYNNNFKVDTTAPTVTSVISGTSDGSFNQGDHIGVSVQFSEVVNVNTSGGTPTICFETGTTDRCVNYASGSGTTTLTFDDYIVQAGDNSSDLEYVDTSALHLNSATIQDAAGNDANLTLPTPGSSGSFSYNNNFLVDTAAPTVTSVISDTSNGLFKQGDHIEVKIQFSEDVDVTSGIPSICFETGATDRCVNYASGSGSETLTFEDYIVQAGDNSSDLEYVDTSALHLNGAVIKDAVGNNADLTLPTPGSSGSFSSNNDFVVDTTSPTIINVISGTPDGYYNQGDHIKITVLFSDTVNVNTSGGIPSICFETGATDRCVNYASGSGSTSLTFDDYIVQAGDNSSDLEYVSATSLSLHGGTIQSDSGNNAILTLPTPGGPNSFSYNNTFVIDTIPPSVASISLSNGSPTTEASVEFFLTFSEYVDGVSATDFSLKIVGLSGASISSVTGDYAWYDITASTGTGNGSLRLDIPNAATITDFAGNPLSGLPFTSGNTYSVVRNQTFQDVASDYWAWEYIERLYIAGITGGCSTNPISYCPDNSVTRAQMAVFLLKGIHGSNFVPPLVGASTGFTDVANDYWAAAWIKQLAAEGITGGCGAGIYCPDDVVTRAQMAVFLLKAKHGSGYTPPAVGASTGFTDVATDYWAAAWIKQLAAEAITGGCGAGIYCPESSVTRAQMAVFLVKTFALP